MSSTVVVAPGVPSIGLELSSYSVSEEDEAVRVCVSLTQEVSFTVTATISTADGTAMGNTHRFMSCPRIRGWGCKYTDSPKPLP